MDPAVELTPRQIQILRAVIEEYITTAEPVGSETLEKKFNLGVSPATIRNEMIRLTSIGMLSQPHTSAGRSPTPGALKYYVEHLMKVKDMSVAETVAVKEKMWDFRQEADKLLREATKTLAESTKALAITATEDGDLYYAGAANILEMPEFYDYQLTHSLFEALDEYDYWWNILSHRTDPFDIMIGEDMGLERLLSRCGFVYHKFKTPHMSGAIGVVGPSRLNYSQVVPVVRYVGDLIVEFAGNW
jgi:heat-inducible transcriptional repressor